MDRKCMKCGEGDPGSGYLCPSCTLDSATDRREYQRLYHRARTAAIRRLVDGHRGEFEGYLAEEKKRVFKTRGVDPTVSAPAEADPFSW